MNITKGQTAGAQSGLLWRDQTIWIGTFPQKMHRHEYQNALHEGKRVHKPSQKSTLHTSRMGATAASTSCLDPPLDVISHPECQSFVFVCCAGRQITMKTKDGL